MKGILIFVLCYSNMQYVFRGFYVTQGVCFNHVCNVYCYESHHSKFSCIQTMIINKVSLKVIAHWVRNFRMRLSIFSCSLNFLLSKCMLRMRKRRKLKLIKFFLTEECFGGSVQTGLTQHEVIFIFLRANISDSVCNDLKSNVFFYIYIILYILLLYILVYTKWKTLTD